MKHSIKINGRRTSISMEQPAYEALKSIAFKRDLTVMQMVESVQRKYPRRDLSGELRKIAAETEREVA